MNLIDKGDTSSLDLVHTRELALNIYNKEGKDRGI
jgi:hypothetical protein